MSTLLFIQCCLHYVCIFQKLNHKQVSFIKCRYCCQIFITKSMLCINYKILCWFLAAIHDERILWRRTVMADITAGMCLQIISLDFNGLYWYCLSLTLDTHQGNLIPDICIGVGMWILVLLDINSVYTPSESCGRYLCQVWNVDIDIGHH